MGSKAEVVCMSLYTPPVHNGILTNVHVHTSVLLK